jgi:hypothetical protein
MKSDSSLSPSAQADVAAERLQARARRKMRALLLSINTVPDLNARLLIKSMIAIRTIEFADQCVNMMLNTAQWVHEQNATPKESKAGG